jgi:penicillin-binding protein 1A
MREFGPNSVIRTMRKMGITTYIDPVPSLCVGSADLSVFEMVAAYNTFPGYGVYSTPMFVTKIEDREGNIISEFSEHRKVAVQAKAAYQMISMMQSVVDGGTGGRLRYAYGLRGQIAGKTGTTNDNSDGWFIGYTPKITAGVWVGAEDRYVHFTSTALGQGANMALPIWGIWMKKVLADGTLGISSSDAFSTAIGVSCKTPPRGREETKDLEEEYF